jgi:hypothetical protein
MPVHLWETPIYRFRIPKDENAESAKLKEIIFDVTGSAPVFTEPSPNLQRIIDEILTSQEFSKVDTVLEFGAAKLKNIPYILGKGKHVCAVDFEELASNPQTKKNLAKCRRHRPRFQQMDFPNPFITDTRKFDLAMLLNVVPVMPVFAERLFLLQLLHTKVNKYILWVAQKEGSSKVETSYKAIREKGMNTCGDGLWIGKKHYFKTFYRYHSVEDVDELMGLYGFKRIKKFSGGSDDAMLYEKTDHILFKDMVTEEKISQHIPIDTTITDPTASRPKVVTESSTINPVSPYPRELSIETLYIEKIKSIPLGVEPELYHRLVSFALARIFRGSLRNMDIKVEIDSGIQIIDTVFTNSAENGFFKTLQSQPSCSCIHPIVEVKNISGDPVNDHIGQLNMRFGQDHGNFGILVCRGVTNKQAVLARCKSVRPNYIIVLTDSDIFQLLEYSRENDQNEINDFMDRKLKELQF